MFPFASERTTFQDRLILEEEEGLAVADTEGSESIDDSDIFEREICLGIEDTFDVDSFLWEILDIMDGSELFEESSLQFLESRSLDRESRSLSVSTESDEIFSTGFEEFDDIAPLWGATGGDGEGWMSGGLGG